nr:MAG TPA: hypothetical protein [Microviridae sp.]
MRVRAYFCFIYTPICLSSLVIYVYLSKNSVNKTNSGGALCGGCNPPSRDFQTSREALEWRSSR